MRLNAQSGRTASSKGAGAPDPSSFSLAPRLAAGASADCPFDFHQVGMKRLSMEYVVLMGALVCCGWTSVFIERV